MENPKVWIIDDNKSECETFASVFGIEFPPNIRIGIIWPLLADIHDYVQLLNSLNTACIIIDQRLKETGDAKYLGIELAQFLRSINTKIPIYILTNFSTDKDAFQGGEWSVEDILDKSDLSKVGSINSKTIIARILRRITNYSDYLAEREQKFHELLRKTLVGQMTPEENAELENIQFERTSPILAKELLQLQELNRLFEEQKKLLGGH
jgi:CheY-like chemotaxis protein